MSLEKRLTTKKTVVLLTVSLLIFLLYLYFFVDLGKIFQILNQANLLVYSLSFVAVFLDTFFYSLTWQFFLRPLSIKPPLRRTYLYVWVGLFVDLLVPSEAISGEISKTYLMSRNSGKTGEVVASVISHRILNMTIFLISLIASSIVLILKHELSGLILNLLIIITTVTTFSMFFLLLLSVRERTTWKIIDWFLRFVAFISKGRWDLHTFRSRARKIFKAFHRSIEVLGRHPRVLVLPVIFSLAAWVFSFLISFFVFISLDQPISLSVLIIVFSVSNAIQTLPVGIPGDIGLTEIVMTSFYSLLGIPLEVSVAATVLIRIVSFWFRLPIGYVALQLEIRS